MAFFWGKPITSGQAAFRVGVELVQSPATVTASTTSVTVTGRLWIWTRYQITDGSNTLRWSGDWTGSDSASFTVGSTSGEWLESHKKVLKTVTKTVTPSFSGTVTTSLSMSLSGVDRVPGTATASGSIVTGKRPVSTPAAPTGASVARVSDTQHTVSWTRNSTTAAPYQAQVVRRWDNVTKAYQTVATVSGTAVSFTDRSTVAGRRYRWQVAGRNTAGTSAYAYTAYAYTAPTPVTSVRALRSGADVRVTWSQPSPLASAYGAEIVRRADGGAWDYAGSAKVGAGVTTWTDTAPDPSKVWEYSVRATVPGPSGTLMSTFVASGPVHLLAPPAAPVVESGVVVANTEGTLVPFRWTHTPTDGTSQRKFELRWRPTGATSWTSVSGASDKSNTGIRAELVGGASGVEWQVRTWGDHDTASPWSALTTIRLAGPPSVTILRPSADVVTAATVSPWWEVFDPEDEGQRSWEGEILDGSGIVVATAAGLSASTWRPNIRLENGQTYTVRIRARAFSGLWSEWAETVFPVQFLPPPVGTLTTSWDVDSGSLSMDVTVPDPAEGEVAAVSAEVWRSIDGGEWQLIAADLPLGAALVDPAPPVGVPVAYKLTTVSDMPSTAESAAQTMTLDSQGWAYMSTGPGWSDMIRVRDNLETSPDWGVDTGLHHMAGRRFPISVRGEAETETVGVSVRLAPDPTGGATWAELLEFARRADVVLWRDPKGRRWPVALPALGGAEARVRESASFTLTRLDPEGLDL